MTLEAKPKVEWDGRDFRGEKCSPKTVRFMKANPEVYEWLKDRPRNSILSGSDAVQGLCEFLGLTPKQFLELDKKTARNKAWEYISTFKMQHPPKAIIQRNNIKSFYLYHNEEPLVFIPQKH